MVTMAINFNREGAGFNSQFKAILGAMELVERSGEVKQSQQRPRSRSSPASVPSSVFIFLSTLSLPVKELAATEVMLE